MTVKNHNNSLANLTFGYIIYNPLGAENENFSLKILTYCLLHSHSKNMSLCVRVRVCLLVCMYACV